MQDSTSLKVGDMLLSKYDRGTFWGKGEIFILLEKKSNLLCTVMNQSGRQIPVVISDFDSI